MSQILLKYVLIVIISSHSIALSGQHFISGKLIDDKNEPIPYAHIVLDQSDKGTISNDSGFFRLEIKKGFENLHFTAIGYEEKILAISILKENVLNTIELAPGKFSLDEVVVKGTFDSATWYVQQVIKRIPKNYPKKRHSQIAFYREASIRDTTYARIAEAIVLLSERGINRKSEDTKYEILQLRKTKDNRDIGWRESLSQWLYQDLGPYMVNKTNPTKPKGVKNSDTNESYLCKSISNARREQPTRLYYEGFIKDCIFEIEGNFKSGGKEFVEISIKPLEEGILNDKFYVVGKMIISKNDFAVVQFEKFQYGVSSFFLKNTLHDSTRAHHLIKWRKNISDNKYYVNYIRDASIGTNSTRFLGTANIREMYESKGNSGFLKQVNEWYVIENKEYEKISWRQGASHDDDIYDISPTKRFEYTFDNINAMPINPISQKMLDDLTHNNSTDALFTEE